MEEDRYLNVLLDLLFDELLAPPPELLLPITLRRIEIDEAFAAVVHPDVRAAEYRAAAAKHRARARELEALITPASE